MDYPDVEFGFYPTPIQETSVDELHPALSAEIGERSSLKIYYAGVYMTPDCTFFGSLELLVDEAAREACGLFRVPFELSERIIGPAWTKHTDIDATVQTYLDGIPDLRLIYAVNDDEEEEMAES
ncbi:MAG: hypothetical protein KGI75_14110 [Rhizobiaceae bacterium]|nr:hypothetical protein [Rhizobiaceae bacterium]